MSGVSDVFGRILGLTPPEVIKARAEANANARRLDKAAERAVGTVGKARGLDMRVIDAGRERVVLERADPDQDAAAIDVPEGVAVEDEAAYRTHKLAEDMAGRFPEGRPVKVGGHYFKVVGTSANRAVLQPHGRNKDGARAPRRARRR